MDTLQTWQSPPICFVSQNPQTLSGPVELELGEQWHPGTLLSSATQHQCAAPSPERFVIHSCEILTGNHMSFVMKFGINTHKWLLVTTLTLAWTPRRFSARSHGPSRKWAMEPGHEPKSGWEFRLPWPLHWLECLTLYHPPKRLLFPVTTVGHNLDPCTGLWPFGHNILVHSWHCVFRQLYPMYVCTSTTLSFHQIYTEALLSLDRYNIGLWHSLFIYVDKVNSDINDTEDSTQILDI